MNLHEMSNLCFIDGCEKPIRAKSLCAKHYERIRRYGDPHKTLYSSDRLSPGATVLERLVSKTTNINDCWVWTGSRNKKGYGRIAVNGQIKAVHRVSYERYIGPIPENLLVCHTCDMPACWNPAHLFAGTNADNMADMCEKDRQSRGESSGTSKLTEKSVIDIRTSYVRGEVLQKELANRYGVTNGTINAVLLRRTWKHL